MRKTTPLAVIALAAGVALTGCASGDTSGSREAAADSSPSKTAAAPEEMFGEDYNSPSPTRKSEAQLDKEWQESLDKMQQELSTFPGTGTFIVGGDLLNIPAKGGTYRTMGPEAGMSSCYWARLSGTSGEFDDIITNGNATGMTVVTIESSDKAFVTQGCQEWKRVEE